MAKNILPLERILTMSASDYAETQGNNLNRYRPVGVRVILADNLECGFFTPTEHETALSEKKRFEPEVIVDYRPITEHTGYGTALIPK